LGCIQTSPITRRVTRDTISAVSFISLFYIYNAKPDYAEWQKNAMAMACLTVLTCVGVFPIANTYAEYWFDLSDFHFIIV